MIFLPCHSERSEESGIDYEKEHSTCILSNFSATLPKGKISLAVGKYNFPRKYHFAKRQNLTQKKGRLAANPYLGFPLRGGSAKGGGEVYSNPPHTSLAKRQNLTPITRSPPPPTHGTTHHRGGDSPACFDALPANRSRSAPTF